MGLCTENWKNVPAKRKFAGNKIHFLEHRPISCFEACYCKEKQELLGHVFDIDPAPEYCQLSSALAQTQLPA